MALKITSSGVWDMCVRLRFCKCSTQHHYLRPGWSLMIFTHLVFTLGHTCMNWVWTSCSTAGGTFRHWRSVVSAESPQGDLWKLVEARGCQRSYDSVFPDELPSCPSLYQDLDSLCSMTQVALLRWYIEQADQLACYCKFILTGISWCRLLRPTYILVIGSLNLPRDRQSRFLSILYWEHALGYNTNMVYTT
jgi:hypothetical protein